MKDKIFILIILICTPFLTGFFWESKYVKANQLYEEGKYQEAFVIYTDIVSKEDPSIKQAIYFRLHEMYLSGHGVSKNANDAIFSLEKVAEGPDQTWIYLARSALADLYLQGKVVPQNINKAIGYYTQMSSSGKVTDRANAFGSLGNLYAFENYGIKRDLTKALDYWGECNKLVPSSCDKSIDIYKDFPEIIVRKNADEFSKSDISIAPGGMERGYQLFKESKHNDAYKIFLWHSKNGNAEAQLELYRIYSLGLVGKNHEKAIGWLYLSARNGNAASQNELGSLIQSGKIGGGENDILKWLNLAAEQNYPDALNNLGLYYSSPSIETKNPPDYSKSFLYFRKASELNLPVAFNNLGVLYLNGLGVDKNLDVAKSYFIKGAELGDLKSKSNLYLNFGVVEKQSAQTQSSRKNVTQKSQAQSSKKKVVEIAQSGNVDNAIKEKEISDKNSTEIESISKPNKLEDKNLSPIELFSQSSPSVFKILAINLIQKEQGVSQGSAVAISSRNVVTNCHVLDKMTSFGTKIDGQVILFKLFKKADKQDLCVLTSNANFPPVKSIRKFESLKVGEKVYAIGSPEGLENTLTEGLISGLRKDKGIRLIQTSAAISHGSSGGGLFDSTGQLIGITSSGIEGTNLNFAISIDELPEF
jgi:TPR repeat protein